MRRSIMLCRKIMLAFAGCIIAASCSNIESDSPFMENDNVSFTSSMKAIARATETEFEEKDEIVVYAVKGDENGNTELKPSGNYADYIRYTYTGGRFINEKGIVRPTEFGVRYFAIYPYPAVTSVPTFKFSVKTNQGASGQYTLSDLCTAVSDVTSAKDVDLVFSHRLSHVVVNLEGEDLGTGYATVRLNDVDTGCDVNLNNNTFVAYDSKEKVYFTDNGTNSYKAIIVPQTIEKGSPFLTVALNGKDYTLKAATDLRFASGKQQTFNLVIDKDEIVTYTGNILPWGTTEEVEEQKVGIYSLEDLVAFRDTRNAGEEVSRWKNEKGEIYIYADIDMSSIENWEPISKIESTETLDGLGHKISGLSMSINNGTTFSDAGLVGHTYGTIKNLHLGEGHIKVNDETTVRFVGAISGNGHHFEIINCSSDVDIESEVTTYGIGGICGGSYSGYIEGCENRGDIVGKGQNSGIVGQLLAETVIFNCVNYGNIEGDSWATGIGRDGNTIGVIKGCKNYGKIVGTFECAGIGLAHIISNCINEGDIIGGYGFGSNTGGIASFANSDDMIIDCINKGSISKGMNCGGIVGKINEDFVGTYNNNQNEGTVNGVPGSESNAIGTDLR